MSNKKYFSVGVFLLEKKQEGLSNHLFRVLSYLILIIRIKKYFVFEVCSLRKRSRKEDPVI